MEALDEVKEAVYSLLERLTLLSRTNSRNEAFQEALYNVEPREMFFRRLLIDSVVVPSALSNLMSALQDEARATQIAALNDAHGQSMLRTALQTLVESPTSPLDIKHQANKYLNELCGAMGAHQL